MENQILRISVPFVLEHALKRPELAQKTVPVRRCWQHKETGSHILAAEELANALTRIIVPGMGRVEKYSGEEGFAKIKNRTGIVFFRNFYGAGMQGDHIDLWDSWRTTNLWVSVGRIQILGGGKYKDGNIWFWPIL